MPPRLRRLAWPLVFVALASVMYVLRVRHEMVDFGVYRTAAVRALQAEPLYRAADGHYQFKYLPAFALAMAPFAWLGPEAATAAWYALSVGLLWVSLRWWITALPDRRRSVQALASLSVVLLGKFYAHELNLGQSNILLGAVLVAALVAARDGRPALAGALVGLGIFVKPYAAILLPWLPLAAGTGGLAAAIAAFGLGLALPALVYGWQGNLDLLVAWYRTVTETTTPNLLGADNVSIAAMWAKWIGAGPAASSLTVATMVAALAAICLVDRFGAMAVPWPIVTGAALGVMSFTIFDLLGRTLYARLMAANIISVCALALVAGLIHLRAREVA